MNTTLRITLSGLLGVALCGFAHQASAAPPSLAGSTSAQTDPVSVEALQHKVAQLQSEVQELQSAQRNSDAQPQYIFDAVPPPNPDNAPIPSGG